jgi:AcrR family transcriptional regulator
MTVVEKQTSAAVLEWVRPPLQARTRAVLVRMLDAGEALFAEKGFDDAPVSEIVERAGASVGSFYRRFKDKDGLLQAVHERFCEEARATTDDALSPERWQDSTTEEMAEAFIGFLLDIFRERAGLFRAFMVRSERDEIVRERTQKLYDHLGEKLAFLLRARGLRTRHSDDIFAARFALMTVLGFLTEVILVHETRFSLTDPRVTESLADGFLSYLRLAPDGATESA